MMAPKSLNHRGVRHPPAGRGTEARDGSIRRKHCAPGFAELVKKGRLPAVAERLPEEPLVIEPQDRVGVYGGTWNSALLGPADAAWLDRTIGYDFLVRWDVAWSEVIPNVALGYDVADEGRTYTFTLRPGLKWSDGAEFTADDVVFAYDDVLLSPDLYSTGPPSQYVSEDGTPAVEKVDDHTVRFVFTEPKALFLQELATPNGDAPTSYPKHYLEQFHPAYGDNVAQLVREAGVSSWVELFEAKRDCWEIPEIYLIGTVLPLASYGIVADDFENVPDTMAGGYLYGTPGPTRPEQYYITES